MHSQAYQVRTKPKPGLTDRHIEILNLASQGKSNIEIANILGISERTVKNHFSEIFLRMDASCRTDAVVKAIQAGTLKISAPRA